MKKHLVILGKVQGVGFRYWMQDLAIKNNISGWVKNKMSGDVEALIVGQKKGIQELIKLCEVGPDSAIVDCVQINDYDKDYSKEGFDIF